MMVLSVALEIEVERYSLMLRTRLIMIGTQVCLKKFFMFGNNSLVVDRFEGSSISRGHLQQ